MTSPILTSTPELLHLCPECGSPSVDYSSLEGGDASCRACKWSGRRDDLLVMPASHSFGSGLESLVAMHNSWRGLFGKFATDIVRFLLEWGFIASREENGKLHLDESLARRYITVAASAALVAVLGEREKIEKEKADGR